MGIELDSNSYEYNLEGLSVKAGMWNRGMVGMRGIRVGMQGIGVRMWEIMVGMARGIKVKGNERIYKNIVLTFWYEKQLKKLI